MLLRIEHETVDVPEVEVVSAISAVNDAYLGITNKTRTKRDWQIARAIIGEFIRATGADFYEKASAQALERSRQYKERRDAEYAVHSQR